MTIFLRPMRSLSQPKNTKNGVPITSAPPISSQVVVGSTFNDCVRKYIA